MREVITPIGIPDGIGRCPITFNFPILHIPTNVQYTKFIKVVTNFRKCETSIFRKAISTYKYQTGRDILRINDTAYFGDGIKIHDHSALIVLSNKIPDLSKFWSIFYTIEAEIEKSRKRHDKRIANRDKLRK